MTSMNPSFAQPHSRSLRSHMLSLSLRRARVPILNSFSVQVPPLTLPTVSISYTQLKDKNADLSAKIEEGFGPNGLGILSISDVPGYSLWRQNLLHLGPRLANLPEDVKRELEDPNSRYNFGWSHGKEKLESGKLAAFKTLGKMILDVGLLLSYHCDRYGLTCGMFSKDAVEILCPDSSAGLYIKTRTGQIVKVEYGVDELAYQIGETTEILSGGRLCATPHCVRAPRGDAASGVDRTTFALFMQPDWDQKLYFPGEVHIHRELIQSNGSLTFGEYTEKLLDKYYQLKM
ncbi:unnamed protein product [Withania somnifera]